MPTRILQERNEFAALFSGGLEDALIRHAADRITHFFYFCFFIEITCDYLSKVHGKVISPKEAISPHATHQVDKGMRDATLDKMDVDSSSPSSLRVTGHASMDAAHTNNLGLSEPFIRACVQYGGQDSMVSQLYYLCEDFCSNTTLLPQSINLGPDKVIDTIHRDMYNAVFSMWSTAPRITDSNVGLYSNKAKWALSSMAVKKVDKNTLAETASYYAKGISGIENKLVEIIGNEVGVIVSKINAFLNNNVFDTRNYVASSIAQATHLSPTRLRQPGTSNASIVTAPVDVYMTD